MTEALSSEAVKDTPSEADDDTAEKVDKSNEHAKADEPGHVEEHVEVLADKGEKRKGGGRHGREPKVIGALVNYYRWYAMQQSRSNADRLHQSMEKPSHSRDNIRTQVDAALLR